MTPSNSFEEPPRSPNFSPPSIRSLLVRLANSENLERGEEKLEGEERDTLDRSTSTGIRASKTPICDHEIRNKLETTEPPRDSRRAPARRLIEVTAPRRFASRRIVPRDYTKIAASSTAPGANHCAQRRPLRLAKPGSTRGTSHRVQHALSPAQPGHALPYRNSIKSGPYSRHPTGQCPNIQRAGVKNRTVAARIDSTADSGHKKLPIAKLSGVIRCGDRI